MAEIAALIQHGPLSLKDIRWSVQKRCSSVLECLQVGRLLTHGRENLGKGESHAQCNEFVCAATRFCSRFNILIDYHSIEVSHFSDVGLEEMFAALQNDWKQILSCSWTEWYATLHRSIRYLAHLLVDKKELSKLAWMVVRTERVALCAVEWMC